MEKRVEHILISGTEAASVDVLLELFELLKGRKATEAERAELERRIDGGLQAG
jgi:hypothetical protein